MKKHISEREWEELSAHLDGQLPVKEAARLAKKLQESSELRAAYDELNRVRSLLRSQPRLRAPRNFTISEQMSGVHAPRPPRRLSPVFGMVSALASVMVVLLLVGEFLVGTSPTALAPAAMEVQSEEAATEAPLMFQAGEEPSSKEIPVESTAEAALRSYPASDSSESGVMAVEAAEEPPAYPVPEQASQVDQEAEALGMAAGEEQEEFPEQPAQSGQSETGWRIAQILLLIVAVLSGLAALILRRKPSQ